MQSGARMAPDRPHPCAPLRSRQTGGESASTACSHCPMWSITATHLASNRLTRSDSRPTICGVRLAIPCTSICGRAILSRRPDSDQWSEDHHHPLPTTPVEDRVAALESLLVEKGILDPAAIDAVVEHYRRAWAQ